MAVMYVIHRRTSSMLKNVPLIFSPQECLKVYLLHHSIHYHCGESRSSSTPIFTTVFFIILFREITQLSSNFLFRQVDKYLQFLDSLHDNNKRIKQRWSRRSQNKTLDQNQYKFLINSQIQSSERKLRKCYNFSITLKRNINKCMSSDLNRLYRWCMPVCLAIKITL